MERAGGGRDPRENADALLAPGEFQTALEALCRITGLGGAIVDPAGRFLAGPLGHQELCDTFALHEGGGRGCLETSVAAILERMACGEPPVHRCPTGFVNAGIPIAIQGRTVAVLILGQVFSSRPAKSVVHRREGGAASGEEGPLPALQKVPIVPRSRLDEIVQEAAGLVGVLSRAIEDRMEAGRARRDLHLRDDALRHGEDRYQTILDAIQEGYFEMDLEARCTFANGAMAEMLGRRLPELVGTNCRSFLAPSSEAVFTGALRRLYLTGQQVQGITYEVLLEDGSRRTLELSAALRLDDRGEPCGYRGLVRDVTGREQAQAMSRATLDSQVTHICILDMKGVIRVVNRAWERHASSASGIPHVEVGVNYLEALEHSRLAGSEHASREAEGIRAVLEGRRGEFVMEYRLQGNGAEARWYHLTATPLLVARVVSGAVLSRRDITERKRAEQELTKVYKAMDSSIDGLALLDPQGSFLYMNPAYAHLHGFDAPVELAGKSWRALYSEAQFRFIESEVLGQLRRVGYWTGELEGLKKDGGTFLQWASLTHAAVEQVIICSVRDISAQKRAEAAAKASQDRLRTIFENVMEGILVLDPEGPRILEANNALLRMFGYPPGESPERLDVLSRIVPEDRPRVLEDLKRVVEENYHEPCLYRATQQDGRSIWIQCLGTRMLYDGRPVDLVAISDITYRREAELALLLSEGRLRAVVESAMDAIFIKDAQRVYVEVNPAFAQLYGLSPEEILGRRQDALVDVEAAARSREMDERVLAGESVHEEVTKRVGGTMRTINIIKVPLRGPGGEVVGICGIARDMTERKRAEEALRRSEEAFRHIVENAPEFYFYVHDPQGRFTYISPSIETVTGYPPEYFLGPHAPIATDSPLNRESDLVAARVLQGEEPPPSQFEVRHRDGRVLVLECHERPLMKDGKVVEVLGLCHNITERIEMERALRESEERFRFLVENAPKSFFYIQNVDMSYAYISPQAEAVTGYSAEYLRGPHEIIMTDNPINEAGRDLTKRILQEGISPLPYRVEIRHRDGSVRMMETHERPIVKDGKVVGLLGLLRDITDRLTMEEELARYRRLEITGALSSGPARRARESLQAMRIAVEALDKKLAGQPAARPYVEILLEQSRGLSDLLRDVVDLAPPVEPARRERRMLSALVDDALDLLRESDPAGARAVAPVPRDRSALYVHADGRSVAQALLRILTHAVLRSPTGGSIVVTLDRREAEAVVRVRDSGTTMAPDVLSGAFAPFGGSGGETGLGMAIAERVAAEHGGRVWAENNDPGPGCTFAFALPLTPAEG